MASQASPPLRNSPHPRLPALAARAVLLTHGLRANAADSEQQQWRRMSEVFLADWPDPIPSAATKQAEQGLGILGAPYYFYAMRAHAAFGLAVFLFNEVADGEDLPCDAMGATPFDTGGLWLGKVDPLSGASEKRRLFTAQDVPLGLWRSRFEQYIIANYADPQGYVRGQPPMHGVPGITNRSPPNEARAWTWEVRYPNRLASGRLRLQCAYVHPEDYERYVDWLPRSGYPDGEIREINQVIDTKVLVHGSDQTASEEAEAALLEST